MANICQNTRKSNLWLISDTGSAIRFSTSYLKQMNIEIYKVSKTAKNTFEKCLYFSGMRLTHIFVKLINWMKSYKQRIHIFARKP